jgi:hypothetical protein
MSKVDSGYPKPHNLIDNEYETLKFISQNKTFQENFGTLYFLANSYTQGHRKNKTDCLNFQSAIEVSKDEKKYKVHLGVNIESKNSAFKLVSYSLCVSSGTSIIRRFHLDYALEHMAKKEISPIFHLQYAGKLKNSIPNHTVEITEESLDLPKLLNTPVTLAILLHIVLVSFPGPDNTHLSKITATSEWKNLLIANEEMVFKPYYESCNRLIKHSISAKKSFLTECYYHNLIQ